MEKLYIILFAFLVSIDFLICGAFRADVSINVAKTVQLYNSIPGLSWKAGRNGFGKFVRFSQLEKNLGWIPKQKETSYKTSAKADEEGNDSDDLPKNYDCRAAYPQCTTIRSIKDQSNCGSCWAVSVASVFSDRLCIHSNGTANFNMSADQLLACDKKSHGCDGGYLDTAWQYIADEGLVSGGDYGSNEGCRPYSIPPTSSFFAPAPKTPECGTNQCPVMYKARNDSIAAVTTEYQIRKEIYKNGPLTTGFSVYLSFKFYKSGIYSRPFFDLIPLGGHAVRVIGWGEKDGIKYWLIANSWGKKWGEEGMFRIRRGTDECGIESNMLAGLPDSKSI